MNNLKSLVLPVIFLILAACGGGSSSPTVLTGEFIDSAVANVTFTTATQSGTTNAAGEFSYIAGETVTFSIGDLKFPAVTATSIVTPITLAGATSITNQQATNIARFLQSLDADGNLNNGITIPSGAATVAVAINFDVDTTTFENDSVVTNIIANSGSTTTSIVSATSAQQHVTDTLSSTTSTADIDVCSVTNSSSFCGIWKSRSNNNTHYVILADSSKILSVYHVPADEFGPAYCLIDLIDADLSTSIISISGNEIYNNLDGSVISILSLGSTNVLNGQNFKEGALVYDRASSVTGACASLGSGYTDSSAN